MRQRAYVATWPDGRESIIKAPTVRACRRVLRLSAGRLPAGLRVRRLILLRDLVDAATHLLAERRQQAET